MIRKITLIFSYLFAGTIILQAQQAWPQFRGLNGQGQAADRGSYPAQLDTLTHLLWKCPVSAGISSPVIWKDRIFLTGIRTDTLETLCIDRRTGRILWTQPIKPEKIERVYDFSSPATPSVVTDGKRVFSYFGSYGLLCYDFNGTLIWERVIPHAGNMYGTAVSPVLADGMLVLSRDSDKDPWLEAMEPATGKTIWRIERPGFRANWSTPVVIDNKGQKELLVYGIWWLKSYRLSDGAELWSFPGLTDEPVTHPVTAEGLVYITSYNMKTNHEVLGLPTWDSVIRLYDKDTDGQINLTEARANNSILSRYDDDGEGNHPLWGFHRWLDADRDGKITETEWGKVVRWVDAFPHENGLFALRPPSESGKDPELVWRHDYGIPECPTPVYANGLLFVTMSGGILSCLDAKTGELKYREKTGAGGPCYASPVYADGKIYIATGRGDLTIVEATNRFRILWQGNLGERIMATPALVDGKVYVRSFGTLWAFGS